MKGRTAVNRKYHIIDRSGQESAKDLTDLLVRGQLVLPLVELIEQSRMAVDELIEVSGRSVIEKVLEMSAQQAVGGGKTQGKARPGEVVRYGYQQGRVTLKERKLKVRKPRLRSKGPGQGKEVAVPAYEAMHNDARMGERMMNILIEGVSTRRYQRVLPQMAESVGISRSSVSRQAVEASAAELEQLLARRFDDVEIVIVYIDGMVFGETTVITAVGVDGNGNKHVLGLQEGATENAAAVKDLLESLVARGIGPDKKRLFVVDGSRALRSAILAIFGAQQPVQRCRIHKLRNVLDRLPNEQKDQVKAAMRAAWRLDDKTGMAKLRKLSEWLERDYPAAANSLLEGLEECFTINRLGVPPSLHRCLATTNIIESPQAGVRMRTRRVCRWRDAAMVKRWVASAFIATEKNFRRIMGYRDLWMLQAILNGSESATRREVA